MYVKFQRITFITSEDNQLTNQLTNEPTDVILIQLHEQMHSIFKM